MTIINCKSKEIYYNAKPLKEEDDLRDERYAFWAQMNNLAMQNIMVQQMKMA